MAGRKRGATKKSKAVLAISDKQLASDINEIKVTADFERLALYDKKWTDAIDTPRFRGWTTFNKLIP